MSLRIAAISVVVLLAAGEAFALPQFAIRSVRACDTCHAEPTGWEDPAVALRKCSLNCNTCHVSPSGGGMRNESGIYYQLQTLPMFGGRPADADYKSVKLAASSQPTVVKEVPAPGTAGRYDGIEPHPTFQIGSDVRMMYYVPRAEGQDAAFFPMQTDLYLAYRPYNPGELNEGRVTLLVNAGFQGSRGEEFDAFTDRAFVREWFAMYHDLPYQMYARAGRFLPAHGWRIDDHTVFTRKPQAILGQGFDFERQVTGVEVGLNPNYLYLHLSLFNAADEWDKPIDGDGGWGVAVASGWRDLAWQAGGSVVVGGRDEFKQVALSAQWALNPQIWLPSLPLIYLGELHLNQVFGELEDTTGLAAFHELEVLIVEGLRAHMRYNWIDPDIKLAFDSGHRLDFGVRWMPLGYMEIITAYRHGWTNDSNRFESDADDFFVQLHGYY